MTTEEPSLTAALGVVRKSAAEVGASFASLEMGSADVSSDELVAHFQEALPLHLSHVERYLEELRKLVSHVEELTRELQQAPPYSETWWRASQGPLVAGGASALERWLQLYVDALLVNELEALERLTVGELASAPREAGMLDDFVQGTTALKAGHEQAARELLERLSETVTDPTTSGLLAIMAARAALADHDGVRAALSLLDRAASSLPGDPRVAAARGDCARVEGDPTRARQEYQAALRGASPEFSACFGLGLLFEAEECWDDADDQYERGISILRGVVPDERVINALRRLLAPVSGNVYLQLGRTLKRDAPRLALAAIDRALELRVSHEGMAPERIAHKLRGEVLEALGQPVEAAVALNEAALGFLHRGETIIAVDLARRAVALAPNVQSTYWTLADSLRIVASSLGPPYLDRAKLEEGQAIWEAGVRLGPPSAGEAWTYAARAGISELQARLPGAARTVLLWEAAAFTERALLFDASDARRLAELTRFYAALRLPASAIEASDQSIASYPSDSVWEERIVLLTNLGFSGPAREALAERESLNPEPQWWYLGTRAYLAECDGRLEQALELAEQALRIKDDVLWCLGLRASCRHKLGRREEAEEDSRQIWQRYDPAGVEDRALFGIIALRLGLIENSRQILETLIETPDDGPKAELYLGLADLREGRAAAGEERIRRGLAGATTPEIREFLDVDLPEALQASGGALDAVGARLRAEIHERLAKPSEPYAAELSRVIADASAARCAQQAALLTLARCRLRDQDYLGALALHARLRGLSPDIPESELALGVNAVLAGLSSRVDEAFAARAPLGIVAPLTEALAFDLDVAAKHQLRWLLGRGLLLAGLGQEAAVHLQAVLASPACEGLENARARASLGYAAFVSAQKGVAKQELRLAIAKLREPGSSATASELGNVCRSYLDSVDRYWELDSLWAELASSPNESDDFRDDVAAARASLRVFLSEHFRLNARPAFPATVSPIIVSLASSLVPDDTSEASPVFASYIPAMRESLQRSTGVPVPAITLRPDEDALAGAYSLLLNEIPAASARLEPGWIYAQSSEAELMGLGVPTSAIHAAPAALGGAWIERDYAEKAAALGVKLLVDPLAFVVRHLERVLRANMDEIFRLSDAEELLGSLAQDEAGAKVLEGALPDAGSRRACARVLRSLVHERVPITNLLAIVAAFGEARTKTTDSRELLRAVRLAISRDLPGIHGPQSVDLPTALESDIQKGMNFEATPPFLALSPPTAHTLLTSLRDLLQSHRAPGHALVVKEAAVRPLVRRLVELEFPEVSVVSAEERLRASQDGGDGALSGGGS